MAEFKRCFQVIDTENTGSITVEALRKYMQRMHYKEGFVEKWIKLFNPDEEGKITFEKYCGTLGLVVRKSMPGSSLEEHSRLEIPRSGTDASPPGERVFDEAESHKTRLMEEPTEQPGAAGRLLRGQHFLDVPETAQTCQPEGLPSPSITSETALLPPIREVTSKVKKHNLQSTVKHKQAQRGLKMEDSPENTSAQINKQTGDTEGLLNHPCRGNDKFTSPADRADTPNTSSLSNKTAPAGKYEIQAIFTPIGAYYPHYEQPTLSECPTDQSATSAKESAKREYTSKKHEFCPSSESIPVDQDQTPTEMEHLDLISEQPGVTVNKNRLEDDSQVISSETNNTDKVCDSDNMKIVGTESKGSSCSPDSKITSVLSLERDLNAKQMLKSLTKMEKYSNILGGDAAAREGLEALSVARVTGQISSIYCEPVEDLPQSFTHLSSTNDPAPMFSFRHATEQADTRKRQKKKRSSAPVPAASEKGKNSLPQYCDEPLVKEAAEPEPLIKCMHGTGEQHPGRPTKALIEDTIIIREAVVMASSAVRDAQPTSPRARTEQLAVSDKKTPQNGADKKSANNRSLVGLAKEPDTGRCEKVILVISASEDKTLSQARDQRRLEEIEVIDRPTTGKRALTTSHGAGTSQAPSHGKRRMRTQVHQANDKSGAMVIKTVTKENKLPLHATGDNSTLVASTIHTQSLSEKHDTLIETTRMCSDQFLEDVLLSEVAKSLHEQTVRQQKVKKPQQTEITMEAQHSIEMVPTEREAPHPTVSMANDSPQIVSVHPSGVQEEDIMSMHTLVVGGGQVERTFKYDACHEGYLATLSPRQRKKSENVQKRWRNRIENYQRKKERRQKCLEEKPKSQGASHLPLRQDNKCPRKYGRRKGIKHQVFTVDDTPKDGLQPPVSAGRSYKYGRFPRGYATQIDPDMWRRLNSKDIRKRRNLLQKEMDSQWKGWRSKKGKRREKLPGRRAEAARLRPSLRRRGVVVILLAGRHRGKRVVSMGKHLASGLLLVTGPFRYNGCPLRRVHPSLVIATKTRVDLKQFRLPARIHQKEYFARPAKRRIRSMFEELLKEESSHQQSLYQPCEQRRADQRLVDTAVIQAIKSHPEPAVLIAYLKSLFSLSKYDRPHRMLF